MTSVRKPGFITCLSILLIGACAAAPRPLARDAAGRPKMLSPAPSAPDRLRDVLEHDAADVLGAAALAQIDAARTTVLVRGPHQFPRMIRQPDGSWKAEPPPVAAAVRTAGGWSRIGARGERRLLNPPASRALDRLLASKKLWSEPAVPAGSCTDPSGIVVLFRHGASERVAAYPCGLAGTGGQAARIVADGGITDWSGIPAEERPQGLPLARFEEPIAASFRYMSGLYEERLMTIRSQAEWEGQWRRITARQGHPPEPPLVDFQREMLLMAAMGPQRSGGYTVFIDRVLEQPGELVAFIRYVSPGPRCGAIAAVTSPADIVRVPTSAKSVRWVTERQRTDCR